MTGTRPGTTCLDGGQNLQLASNDFGDRLGHVEALAPDLGGSGIGKYSRGIDSTSGRPEVIPPLRRGDSASSGAGRRRNRKSARSDIRHRRQGGRVTRLAPPCILHRMKGEARRWRASPVHPQKQPAHPGCVASEHMTSIRVTWHAVPAPSFRERPGPPPTLLQTYSKRTSPFRTSANTVTPVPPTPSSSHTPRVAPP